MRSSIRDIRAFIAWYKRTAPCTDCGGFFDAACMDFDHVPERGKKSGQITEFVKGKLRGTEEDLWAEIAKCDVVCSNCHRIRTKIRGVPKLARDKISKKRKGRKTVHTEESKAKIGAAARKRRLSPESRMKISMALRGRHKSLETRQRMSDSVRLARSGGN